MATTRSTPGPAITNGDDPFGVSPGLRQPVEDLGPRAQRTIARIIEATRDVFLVARVLGHDHRRDRPGRRRVESVLLHLLHLEARGVARRRRPLGERERSPGRPVARARIDSGRSTQWVTEFFDLLDVHGSLSFAWTQAAQEDDCDPYRRHASPRQHVPSLRGTPRRHRRQDLRRTRPSSASSPPRRWNAAGTTASCTPTRSTGRT